MNKKYLIGITLTLALVAGIGVFIARPAGANPPVTSECGASGAATSSVTYMTPGTGTTTATCLTQPANATGANEAYLSIDRIASSTLSNMRIDIEHSQDGINWYRDNISDTGTSTLASANSIYAPFASSTLPGGGQVPNPNNRDAMLIKIRTPLKYVRAVITVPIGAANSAVRAAIYTKKEI